MEMAQPGQQLMDIQAAAGIELRNALAKIQPLEAARLQQKRKLLEAVTCFEQQNMYVIYAGTDISSNPLYWVQENSSCIQRNLLPNDCAPWNLTYHDINGQLADGTSGKHFPVFMEIDRPCSFTFCCLNRPTATIIEKPSGRVLGSLRDPWALCNITSQILGANGEETLKSNVCCCKPGLFCMCPGCKVDFPIMDSASDNVMANIVKTWVCGDICPLCSKDWSNVTVHFGQATNTDYKLLLLALGNFVQLRNFDSRNS